MMHAVNCATINGFFLPRLCRIVPFLWLLSTFYFPLLTFHLRAQTGPLRTDSLQVDSLELFYSVEVDIPEPSGLAISRDGRYLWTVSDRKKRAYKLDLQGNILKKLPKTEYDLEGISTGKSDAALWLVDEKRRRLIQIDTLGNEQRRVKLAVEGDKNSGLEGIAWNSRAGIFYVLHEKEPGKLIRLTREFAVDREFPLDVALDYSGLFYDAALDKCWIISDESALLMLWSEQRGVERAFALPVEKAEGVAVDRAQRRIYIISDKERVLYAFRLPE